MLRIYLLILLLWLIPTLQAAEFIVKDVDRDDNGSSTWIALPYAFSSDATGLTGGIAGIFHGFLQPQMTMVITAFRGESLPVNEYGSNGAVSKEEAYSKGFFLGISGVRVPYTERFFMSFLGMRAYYPNQQIYVDGSNDSVRDIESKDYTNLTPFQTQGWSNWSYLDLRYVLPIGASSQEILPIIKTRRGIAINRENVGGGIPFITGQTIAGVKPFYQRWTADKLDPNAEISTNGLKGYIEHDNTDYPDNPSRGYSMRFEYAQDFGWSESTEAWNALEAEYSHYIELPLPSWMRHQVIAVNGWTAYSPSWDKSSPIPKDDGSGEDSVFDKGQPPMWEGARLGGWNRMRAYDSNRFSDKAAIYGTIEYRMIPNFNPMNDQKWSPIPIDWFQAVIFAEAGRVAPQYNLDLFKDLKYDAGFSIRALAATLPIRFDMAFGSEGSSMWVMIQQPF